MKNGQRVMLVGTDGFMPPQGSIGTILFREPDAGDYGVLFPEYPCPAGPGDWWYADGSWLVPLSPAPVKEVAECEKI